MFVYQINRLTCEEILIVDPETTIRREEYELERITKRKSSTKELHGITKFSSHNTSNWL